MSNKYMVGSLFAGVGGICLGFKTAHYNDSKYELVWANEMDEYAAETYRTNFNHNLIQGDIRKVLDPELVSVEGEDYIKLCQNRINIIDNYVNNQKEYEELSEDLQKTIEQYKDKKLSLKNIDINTFKEYLQKVKIKIEKEIDEITKRIPIEIASYKEKHEEILKNKLDVLNGGFPCQAFSIAGEQKGFDDERGNLFLNIIDLINQLQEKHGKEGIHGTDAKPRILFLENVKNLENHDGGRTYSVIKSKLEKTGYIIKEHVLNTMDYSDLPQNRERIYIIGFLHKEDADKFDLFDNLEIHRNNKTVEDRKNDIRHLIDYKLTKKELEKYYYTDKKYPNYFITEEKYNAMPESERRNERINLDEQINEMYQFYQVRRGMYVRKNMSNVCPTLTANMGTGGHNVPLIKVNDGIRKLTPSETFKLQGFPVGDGYELPTQYNGKSYGDAPLYKQAGNAVSVPVIRFLAEEILKVLEA